MMPMRLQPISHMTPMDEAEPALLHFGRTRRCLARCPGSFAGDPCVDPGGRPPLPFAVGVFRGEWPLRRPFFAHRPSRDLVTAAALRLRTDPARGGSSV